MFFNKKTKTTNSKLGHIVIIGTSPLAFILADIIQNNNYDVSFLVSKLDSQNFNSCKPFSIKYSNTQTNQLYLSFTDNIIKSPDYCILASDLENLKSDFLLLQNPLLKDTNLINFVSNYTQKFINKTYIPAYFNGWLQRDKNNIIALNKNIEITFFCNNKKDFNISNIFSSPHLSFSYNDKSLPNFWEQTSSFLIANLLILKYKQSPSCLLLDENIRKQVDAILKEISFLAKKNSENFDSSKSLASIYAIPNNYNGEINNVKSFNNLVPSITSINHFDTPFLHNLIVSATNNIIV